MEFESRQMQILLRSPLIFCHAAVPVDGAYLMPFGTMISAFSKQLMDFSAIARQIIYCNSYLI